MEEGDEEEEKGKEEKVVEEEDGESEVEWRYGNGIAQIAHNHILLCCCEFYIVSSSPLTACETQMHQQRKSPPHIAKSAG